MSEPLKIKIKYLFDELTRAEKIDKGDWIDLYSAEDVELKAFEWHAIPLGVCMELPDGYEAHLTSRSSMCKNFGIIHSDDLGVIDQSYCGDNDQWFLPVLAVRDTHIKFNDKICQFRIEKKMPPVELVEVDHLGNPDRGGIGSTGKK